MKEKEIERDMDWRHGWWCAGKKRFGFGFWLGIFILIWGVYEILREFAFMKLPSFPFWPLILVFIGLAMVLNRL